MGDPKTWEEPPVPADISELAGLLAPAVQIDSTFLRNFRRRHLPHTDTGLEARFWHSDLVEIQGVGMIQLDWERVDGLGREAYQVSPERFEQAWRTIQELHRHLPENLQLQEALRFAAITGESIESLIARIHKTFSELKQSQRRRSLGRWLKAAIPELPDQDRDGQLVQWLSALARAELGDAPPRLTQEEYERAADIPDWLFPERENPLPHLIGLQLTPGLIRVVESSLSLAKLELESDKPTLLRVVWNVGNEKKGGWLQTRLDAALAIDQACRSVEILVPDGRRFNLQTIRKDDQPETEYVLLYHPEDRELAKTLQGILQGGGIGLELREESVRQTERDFSDRPVLCLWTRNAASHWQALVTERATPPPGLLLRTDPSALPPADSGSADIIDLLDLGDTQSLEQAITRLKIQKLLNEIDNPNTTPQRRLEIGDQLAELGDPRHGVGVYEAQAGVEAEEQESIERYPPEIKSLLDEIENTETAPKRRLAIGDELVRLGDPRHGVGLDARGLPDIDWVEIPEGEFIYGEGKKQQTIYLEGFRISRYLITNVQYQSFIDAGGYKEERWWRDLKRPEPEKSRWEQTNRPRTNVDWYEAVAFSRWLAEQLKQPIHLPTEQEWERAARGTDGRAYPWGDEYLNGYANTKESSNKGEYLEQTTAVGLYPQGGSPDGVMDLAGTVWDWCLNKYDHPEQIEPDNSGEGRVLRGGSWIDHPENARAASRGRFVPDDRINRWGFRVVWSAPIK